MDWSTLRNEIVEVSGRVSDLLKAARDPTAPVPGLDWTVGELGAHLVSVPRRYQRMLAENMPFPESLAQLNEADIDAIEERELDRLGSMLQQEISALFDILGDDGDRPVWFFGIDHTVRGLGGVLLGELLLHGLDLTRVVGKEWEIRRDQALAISDGLVPSLANAVDRSVAERMQGTYHLHLRGGRDWTIVVDNSRASVRPGRPKRADLRVSADPVANLLVGYGRIPRWRAVVSGKIIAWGGKPWRALRFGSLFRET